MQIERLEALFGACALLWVVESRWPLVAFGRERSRHVVPNLALASLTVAMNLAFSRALRPTWLEAGRWSDAWPLWLQAGAAVAALDLFAWSSHVLLHKTAWGWRMHRVHHSDVTVDVTTALRQHPGETIWRIAWRVLPLAILGIPIRLAALYEALSAANALLEHANIGVPASAERIVGWLLVTPGMHKWHHSRDPRETDTNYGNILSIWDRLFGTFTAQGQPGGLRYGLDGFDGSDSQSLGGLLRMPMAGMR
jgi:sterol desaturase/sphingolipid hydroxylase (fatty acid hydroxylase superfamily)